MSRPKPAEPRLQLWIPSSVAERIGGVAAMLAPDVPPELRPSRTQVALAAIGVGLDELERRAAKIAPKLPAPKKPKKKRRKLEPGESVEREPHPVGLPLSQDPPIAPEIRVGEDRPPTVEEYEAMQRDVSAAGEAWAAGVAAALPSGPASEDAAERTADLFDPPLTDPPSDVTGEGPFPAEVPS
jgi:hypothetical protein